MLLQVCVAVAATADALLLLSTAEKAVGIQLVTGTSLTGHAATKPLLGILRPKPQYLQVDSKHITEG
jgi:hypothetical protein